MKFPPPHNTLTNQMQTMSTTMASFSPPTHFSPTLKPRFLNKSNFFFFSSLKQRNLSFSPLKVAADNGVGTAVEPPPEQAALEPSPPAPVEDSAAGTNGSVGVAEKSEEVKIKNFVDPRWVGGTWDLKQFQKNGTTDWDAVIDAGNLILC